jgi:hypothetical protein
LLQATGDGVFLIFARHPKIRYLGDVIFLIHQAVSGRKIPVKNDAMSNCIAKFAREYTCL